MKKEYTISELETLTGFSRRTIHFYIKEGLIPSPGSVGTGAKYGEEHFLRLMMIGILQKQDLKLNGIRKTLESMTLIQMEETVSRESVTRTSHAMTNLFSGVYSIHRTALPAVPAERYAEQKNTHTTENSVRENSIVPATGGFLQNKRILTVAEGQSEEYNSEATKENTSQKPEKQEEMHSIETWRHIEVADGIEMNVREDIFNRYKTVILELINKFKEQ